MSTFTIPAILAGLALSLAAMTGGGSVAANTAKGAACCDNCADCCAGNCADCCGDNCADCCGAGCCAAAAPASSCCAG